MKKSPCVYWCLVFLAFSPAIKAESQLPKEAAFWQQAVAGSSLVEIARTMRDKTTPWPQVDAAKSAPSWQVDLINQLHRIIKQSFNPNAPTNPDEAKAYLQIAKVLTDAGGYSNILLADSLYRLVFSEQHKICLHLLITGGKWKVLSESFPRLLSASKNGLHHSKKMILV